MYNYAGILCDTDEVGNVSGSLRFVKVGGDSEPVLCPLVNSPSASGSHASNTKALLYMAPPTMGGQCLRRLT